MVVVAGRQSKFQVAVETFDCWQPCSCRPLLVNLEQGVLRFFAAALAECMFTETYRAVQGRTGAPIHR